MRNKRASLCTTFSPKQEVETRIVMPQTMGEQGENAPRYASNHGRTGSSMRLMVPHTLGRTGSSMRLMVPHTSGWVYPGWYRCYIPRVYTRVVQVLHTQGVYPGGVYPGVYTSLYLGGVYLPMYTRCIPPVYTTLCTPGVYHPCIPSYVHPGYTSCMYYSAVLMCSNVGVSEKRPWALFGRIPWVREASAHSGPPSPKE